MAMEPKLYDRALVDPASVFEGPEDVVARPELSKKEKIEILRRWEYQASDEAVALEEGMPGDDTDLLQRTLIALGLVAGPLDLERTSPDKQHGLGPCSIKLDC